MAYKEPGNPTVLTFLPAHEASSVRAPQLLYASMAALRSLVRLLSARVVVAAYPDAFPLDIDAVSVDNGAAQWLVSPWPAHVRPPPRYTQIAPCPVDGVRLPDVECLVAPLLRQQTPSGHTITVYSFAVERTAVCVDAEELALVDVLELRCPVAPVSVPLERVDGQVWAAGPVGGHARRCALRDRLLEPRTLFRADAHGGLVSCGRVGVVSLRAASGGGFPRGAWVDGGAARRTGPVTGRCHWRAGPRRMHCADTCGRSRR